jgi:lysozyme
MSDVKGPVELPAAITRELLTDLKRDEGLRLTAYRDTVDVWTVGYGHAHVKPGTVWTRAQAEAALIADILAAQADLDAKLPWWRTLDQVRQDALTNLCFNMGITRLLEFRNTLAAIKAHDWKRASVGLMASRYAVQVKGRAVRVAQMIATGER